MKLKPQETVSWCGRSRKRRRPPVASCFPTSRRKGRRRAWSSLSVTDKLDEDADKQIPIDIAEVTRSSTRSTAARIKVNGEELLVLRRTDVRLSVSMSDEPRRRHRSNRRPADMADLRDGVAGTSSDYATRSLTSVAARRPPPARAGCRAAASHATLGCQFESLSSRRPIVLDCGAFAIARCVIRR